MQRAGNSSSATGQAGKSARPREDSAKADRVALIVGTARSLLGEHGLQGTTIAKIAESAGMSQGGIYRHFASRTDILIGVVEDIFDQVYALYQSAPGTDPLQQLREMTARHSQLMADEAHSFARPWLELIATAPRMGLREVVADRQTAAFNRLSTLVRAGKDAGSIQSDVDPDELAWQILNWAWGENVGSSLGLQQAVGGKYSARLIEQILDAAAT